MIWADMDYEERCQELYRRSRAGDTVKQIAAYLQTTTKTLNDFARAESIAVRHRLPALKLVRVRKRIRQLSPQSTLSPIRNRATGLHSSEPLADQAEQAHAGT